MAPEGLGVDIGGVIIDRVREERGAGPEGFASALPVAGAFAAVGRLIAERFRERVWLVSRCDAEDETPIRRWLEQRGFFPATGLTPDRVRFCRERDEKTPICRQLGVTHFVDDRLEVLGHMVGVVPNLYHLRSRAADHERFPQFLRHVRSVAGWDEIVRALLPGD
jgi:hypothetical protein